jgi:hypothetical protein
MRALRNTGYSVNRLYNCDYLGEGHDPVSEMLIMLNMTFLYNYSNISSVGEKHAVLPHHMRLSLFDLWFLHVSQDRTRPHKFVIER